MVLFISSLIERIEKSPAMGELGLKPGYCYYTDSEGKFGIGYVVLKKNKGIHVVVVRLECDILLL
ncbi:MAG: hypothetical protein HQM14_01250 [SAR324 cluster bacterium]|nr:hypothetical protein [SAR324 cluster bacterium]